MRHNWLNTRSGIDFTAIGLVAIGVGAPLLVFHDLWFVAAGESPNMWLYDKVLTYALASLAAVFSFTNFFIFRHGIPKYVAAIVAISFASYIVQPLLPIHRTQYISAICLARTLGVCTMLLLVRSYVLDQKRGSSLDS